MRTHNSLGLAPVISLALAVLAVGVTLAGCPRVPEPLQQPKRVATVEMGDPIIVDAGPSIDAEPVPPTALEAEVIAVADDDDTDHEQVGDALAALDKTADAIQSYRMALSRGATAARWQKLGDVYVKSGDTVRGKRALVEALALDPSASAAMRSLTKLALDAQDAKTARTLAEDLVARTPDDIVARRLLGRAYLQSNMWREAITEIEKVVIAKPDDVFAHNNIGFAALQIGELDKARDHLERCLSLEPQHGYMMNNLGVTYERLGRRAEAHAAFTRAGELDPKYASARVNRERIAARLTDEERIEAAETLLALRTPPIDGGSVPAGVAADDVGGDAVVEELGTDASAAGGSARLAPSP